MRIDRLHLERYGAFADRALDFHPEAALHIVFGANEAGKTSALSIGSYLKLSIKGMMPLNVTAPVTKTMSRDMEFGMSSTKVPLLKVRLLEFRN